MKKIFFLLFIISSCNSKHADISEQAKTEIINADKAMNELASKKGFYEALLQYSDQGVIKPKEAELPVIGKNNLQKYWANKTHIREIKWQPVLCDASKSGDIGYTFGNWSYTTKDTIMYGNYCTIWKKQTDGSWKFIYDGGNNTPNPYK